MVKPFGRVWVIYQHESITEVFIKEDENEWKKIKSKMATQLESNLTSSSPLICRPLMTCTVFTKMCISNLTPNAEVSWEISCPFFPLQFFCLHLFIFPLFCLFVFFPACVIDSISLCYMCQVSFYLFFIYSVMNKFCYR